ncbi:MAG: glycosyltransferase family 39 protein, partial [Pygmaiobacter sp.]
MIQNDTAFSGERPSRLLLAFKGGFVAVFLVLVGCILADYDQNFAFSLPAALAALLLIAVFLFLCFKIIQHDRFVARHFGIIVAFAAIFLFTAQLFFASRLRFDPIFDLEAVFRGAQDWAQTGSFTDYASSTCYGNYFYMFPNNLGALALLTALFRVALLLHFTDFFAVATLFCALLFCAAMVLSALCARRLFGAAGGVISLLFFLCCPPFYLIAPVFYTDALSLPFPILAFFLFLRSEAATTRCRRILYQLAMALALAFGALLKPTVLLCAIAIALFLLCRKQWKKALAWGLLSALVAALVFSAFFAFIYRTQLNQTTAQQLKIPTSYWLATAVSGKGQFCSDCFVLALRTPDPTLRDTALKAVIAEQLHARDLHS